MSGVRIVDLSRLVAGNMVTHVLADLGADVIKVEHPRARRRPPPLAGEGCRDVLEAYGRNKRSIALDLKRDERPRSVGQLLTSRRGDRREFRAWHAGAHGYLRRRGFAPSTRARGGAPVGMGTDGPLPRKPGFGTLVEAMSGFADVNGFPTRRLSAAVALADMIAGLYAAVGLLTGLRHVEVGGGPGQVVDISLFEPIFSLISVAGGELRLTGAPIRRNGNQSPTPPRATSISVPDGLYVALSGLDADHGGEDLPDHRAARTGRRSALPHERRPAGNCDTLDAIIGEFIGRRETGRNKSRAVREPPGHRWSGPFGRRS